MIIRTLLALGIGLGLLAPPVPGTANPPPELRRIPVTVATDSDFRAVSNWRGFLRTVIDRATGELEPVAGLTFEVVEEVNWTPPEDASDLSQVLESAVSAVDVEEGILMVFLGRPPRRMADPDQKGFAYLGRPALVVLVPEVTKPGFAARLRSRAALMVRHELGHVFGLPHLRQGSVMHPILEDRREHFQGLELDVLRANRNLDFHTASPFSGSDVIVLRDVYRIWDDRGEIDPSLLVNLGVALHREGRPGDARELFERALARNGKSTVARLGMAQTATAIGDDALAREMIEPIDPRTLDSPALEVLGAVRLQLGEAAAAESLLSRALTTPSPRFSGWFNRGLARFRLERYRGAREDFLAALDREERREGWFNLGLTEDALGNPDASDRAFLRFLELAPDSAQAAQARAFLEQHARSR